MRDIEKRRLKKQKGMTIIEMAIALAVIAVASGALVSMGLATVALSTSSKRRSQATALAVDRIEQYRACRDERRSIEGVYNCPEGAVDPIFTRIDFLSPPGFLGGDNVGIIVEVSWNERGTVKRINIETRLSQWKIREATGQ